MRVTVRETCSWGEVGKTERGEQFAAKPNNALDETR